MARLTAMRMVGLAQLIHRSGAIGRTFGLRRLRRYISPTWLALTEIADLRPLDLAEARLESQIVGAGCNHHGNQRRWRAQSSSEAQRSPPSVLATP
jgi:hypothetical protein